MATVTSRHPKPLRRGAACAGCRRSKQACDAARPECSSCVLRHRECNYVTFTGPVQRRKEKVNKLENELNEALAVATISSGSSTASSSEGPRTVSPNIIPLPDPTGALSGDNVKEWPLFVPAPPPPSIHEGYPRQMLERFLPYRQHFGLDIDPHRWTRCVSLPTSHPESFHPALLNAICLIGSSLGEFNPREHEEHYYKAARDEMQLSLSLCDRMEDWFYTTVLLQGYLLRHARLHGLVELSLAAIPIAVACNLHQQDPKNYRQQNYGLLQTPRDEMHANDRVNLWWSLWMADKRSSIGLDVPPAFPHRDVEAITTPIPVARSTIEQIGIQNCERITLRDTLSPVHCAMDTSMDSLLGLRVKSWLILAESVRTANAHRGKEDIPSCTDIPTIERVMGVFLDTMPRNQVARQELPNPVVPLKPLIARTTLSALCASVILHSINADKDPVEFQHQVAAARWMADLYRELNGIPGFLYSYVCIAPYWACGRGVLEKEIARVRAENSPGASEYIATLNDELLWMNEFVDHDYAAVVGEFYAPKPFPMLG